MLASFVQLSYASACSTVLPAACRQQHCSSSSPRARRLRWGSKHSPKQCIRDRLRGGSYISFQPLLRTLMRNLPVSPTKGVKTEFPLILFLSQQRCCQHRACCWMTMVKCRKLKHRRLRPGGIFIHWFWGRSLPPLPNLFSSLLFCTLENLSFISAASTGCFQSMFCTGFLFYKFQIS